MGLLKEAAAREYPTPGPRCTYAIIHERLDSEVAADLDDLIINPAANGKLTDCTVIARELFKLTGVTISARSLLRHRQTMIGGAGGCKCLR